MYLQNKKYNPVLFALLMLMMLFLFSVKVASAEEYPMLKDTIEGENIETFYIERPNPEALKENVVNASSFGLNVDNEDNFQAFSDALTYCKNHPNTYLVIDKGVYYFKTNASLTLSGFKNVLIEGNGAEFIFETQKQFVINGCDGVELRNLIIDWNWAKNRIASLVEVQNKTEDSFEIKFLELDEVDVDIPLVSFQQYDSKDHVPGSYGGWKTFNPIEVPGSVVGVEKIEPNVLKVAISKSFTTSFHNEDVYILRHYTYGGSVFNVYGGSSNITFDNVRIYGSAGMGYVFGEKANHFQVINSYIGLRPGNETKQRMATTADGIHILNTGGYFRIDSCDFSYTGDDILNIHDDLAMVTRVSSPNQFTGNATSAIAGKGDKLRIYNKNVEDIGFETEVLGVTRNGDTITVTVKDELPAEVEKGYYAYRSGDVTHNYVISNNYIHETKGRAALLNAADGLFVNNRMYRTVSECVQVRVDLADRTDKLWFEGSGAKNVVIKNNIFEECAFGGKSSIITIDCNIGNRKNVLNDIHITGNEFQYCYGAKALISADNVSDLYIENNLIADCGDIVISEDCGAVYNSGNTITHPSENCSHTDTKIVGDRKAGCFEYGSTGKTYCNQCHTITDPTIRGIPPLNHKNLQVKRTDVQPTCTENGSSSMVCSLCRTVLESGIAEPATGHSWSASQNGNHQCALCLGLEAHVDENRDEKCDVCGSSMPKKQENPTPKPKPEPEQKPEPKPETKPEPKPEPVPTPELVKNGFNRAKDGNYIYYQDGVPQLSKFGFVLVDGVKFLIVNGKYESSINGLYNDPEHTEDWYFLAEGRAQTQHTGLVSYDGAWFYVNQGKMDSTIGGYVEYDGGLFFVGVGRIMTEVNGLAQDPKNPTDWYFLANGQAQTQYTGLAQYDGAWFYVINGKLANDYTGTVAYNGANFYVVNGMLK